MILPVDLSKTRAKIKRIVVATAEGQEYVAADDDEAIGPQYCNAGFIGSYLKGDFFLCGRDNENVKQWCIIIATDVDAAARTVATYYHPQTNWHAMPVSLKWIEFYPQKTY